jgi:hypothetical protein
MKRGKKAVLIMLAMIVSIKAYLAEGRQVDNEKSGVRNATLFRM